MKRSSALILTIAVTACGNKNPAGPNPPTSTPTRVIVLTGNLAFGNITIGQSFDATLKIENQGNSTMTVSSLSVTGGMSSVLAASWTSGTIGAGGSQNSTIRFTPTAAQSYTGTLVVNADQTSGTNSIAASGTGVNPPPPPGPKTSFGAGTYLVNADIVAARYFTGPVTNCYWERESGLGGTLGEIIANDFVAYLAGQVVVDILSSDKAFKTESNCSTWNQSARGGLKTNITPGFWLVGSQVSAGLYRSNVSSGCYWERLRNFQGVLDSIIANGFISSAGQQFLEPRSTDTGVQSDGDCGTWTPSTSADAGLGPTSLQRFQTREEIAANRALFLRKRGR